MSRFWGLTERGLEPTDVWNPNRAPYPGLPSFQEEDAAVFFGRSAKILALREGPERRADLVLEDNLVLKLVHDAGQPDSLPLLAFILRRLYDPHFGSPQADRQTTLRLRDYDQLGGLPGLVKNAADRILKDPYLTEDIINQLRRAFIPGLVRDNDEGSYSRRRAFFNKLPLGSLSLLEKFVQARLLVKKKDKDGQETVEIAHETFLRTWPTLTAWLGDDRGKLRQHSFIIRAANEWNEKDRSDDPKLQHFPKIRSSANNQEEQRCLR